MLTTKRALIFAVLSYAVSFVIGIAYSLATGYDPSQTVGAQPLSFCITIVAGSAFSAIVATYLYFTHKAPKLKADAKHGFKFGITLLVLGTILDAILFLPLVVSMGKIEQVATYYGNVYFYVALLGVVASATGVGYWLGKNPRK